MLASSIKGASPIATAFETAVEVCVLSSSAILIETRGYYTIHTHTLSAELCMTWIDFAFSVITCDGHAASCLPRTRVRSDRCRAEDDVVDKSSVVDGSVVICVCHEFFDLFCGQGLPQCLQNGNHGIGTDATVFLSIECLKRANQTFRAVHSTNRSPKPTLAVDTLHEEPRGKSLKSNEHNTTLSNNRDALGPCLVEEPSAEPELARAICAWRCSNPEKAEAAEDGPQHWPGGARDCPARRALRIPAIEDQERCREEER